MLEITRFGDYMNRPMSEEYDTITGKYRTDLQELITPPDFVKALLMAEEYKAEGFTLDGFIEELKKVITKSMPDYNIKVTESVDKQLSKAHKTLSDIRLYTDITSDIANQN